MKAAKQIGQAWPRTYSWILAGIILILGIAHQAATYADLYYPSSWLAKHASWFNLDREYNIPTAFIALLMLACAVACLRNAYRLRPLSVQSLWAAFSLLFIYFAADEWFILHEQIAEPVRDKLSISEGPLFHAWVIPVGLIVLAAGIGYLCIHYWKIKTLLRYSRLYLYLLLLAGGIVAIEILGTFVYENPALYRMGAVFIEELYEFGMTGLLLYTIVGYGATGTRSR